MTIFPEEPCLQASGCSTNQTQTTDSTSYQGRVRPYYYFCLLRSIRRYVGATSHCLFHAPTHEAKGLRLIKPVLQRFDGGSRPMGLYHTYEHNQRFTSIISWLSRLSLSIQCISSILFPHRCFKMGHLWRFDSHTLGGDWIRCERCNKLDEYLPGVHEPKGYRW